MDKAEYLWGLTANSWTAVGTWTLVLATLALFIATLALVIVAHTQLSSSRDEAKKSRTLAICERYDFDPLMDASIRRIRAAPSLVLKNPKKYKQDILTILNYFEQIALGIKYDVYDHRIICDFMSDIADGYVAEFIESGITRKLGCEANQFSEIESLCKLWRRAR